MLPSPPRQRQANHSARQVLKRLTKEAVREKGRQLAKCAHANPTCVFTTMLTQAEAYYNLVPIIVDSLR